VVCLDVGVAWDRVLLVFLGTANLFWKVVDNVDDVRLDTI